jgi:GTP-binding protein YchF
MKLGILGMPLSGKTTVFELLAETRIDNRNQKKANLAMVRIPDKRIDHLSSVYKPKKTTYAQLEIVDIPGINESERKSSGMFLDNVRKADALLLIVRGFADVSGLAADPMGDMENLSYELLLSDLDLIEKRIQRINDSKKKNTMLEELELLNQLRAALSDELPLSSVELGPEEQKALSSYQFLTLKPMLVCLNLSDEHLNSGAYPGREAVTAYCTERGIPLVELSANIEQEISELPAEERKEFLSDLGLEESGLSRIARGLYERLQLLSFFTVGEDEVRAWTIYRGTIAKHAAGKIHSDIERGFIRAEVFSYGDFTAWGTVAALKEKGLFRLEGKEYVILDGDIVHFRFNI